MEKEKDVTRIVFNGGDETEFDTTDASEVWNLWVDFCHENNLPVSSIENIYSAKGE